MSQDQINPQVVLTANNQQYDQAMGQSAQATDGLGKSIDTLTQKISHMTRAAGKTLIGISAADVATITAATVAYGAYEKQMSQLQAQAAVLGVTMGNQRAQMAAYSQSVESLRVKFGTTTSEAAALTLQLSKMSDHTTSISALAQTFVKMSYATGESSTTLAQSVLNLERVMGTPQRNTQKYADQLTSLAATSNTSASALADFASQIAPIGRLIGQSQTDITGVATAFTKAGQDGYQAATAYTKVVTDIAQATQSGSPDLAKYANLVGLTVDQFKQLSGTDKVLKFFQSVNQMGPSAITQLNRLGLDGTRTVRAITAMSQQTGGLQQSINQARESYGDGSVNAGAAGGMDNMVHQLQQIRSELTLTAEAFGRTFAPAMKDILTVTEKLTDAFRQLMDGPFGDLVKLVAVAVAPIAALGGGLLLVAGTVAKLASAAFLLGSGARGAQEGYRGFGQIVKQPGGGYGPVAGETLGARGAMVAANGSWLQRWGYNAGAGAGGMAGGIGAAIRSDAEGASMAARAGAAGVGATAFGVRTMGSIYSPLTFKGWNDPTQRSRMFNAQEPFSFMNRGAGGTMGQAGAAATATAAAEDVAKASRTISSEAGPLARSFRSLGTSTGYLLGNMASATANAGKMAGGVAARGAVSAGGAAMSAVGGPVGVAMIGLLLAPIIYSMLKGKGDQTTYSAPTLSGSASSYMQAGGIADRTAIGTTSTSGSANISLGRAQQITGPDIAQATGAGYTPTDTGKQLAGMNVAQATAFLGTRFSEYKNNPAALQSLKLDLISSLGQAGAMQVLSNLQGGTSAGLSAFMSPGSFRTNASTGTAMSGAFGYVNNQAVSAWNTGGDTAYAQSRLGGFAAIQQGMGNIADLHNLNSDSLKRLMSAGDTFQQNTGFDFTSDESIATLDSSKLTELLTDKNFQDQVKRLKDGKVPNAAALGNLISQVLVEPGKDNANMKNLLALAGVKDTTLTGNAAVNAVVDQMLKDGQNPATTSSALQYRIGRMSKVGAGFIGSSDVQAALLAPESNNAQYTAINSQYSQLLAQGYTPAQINRQMGNIRAQAGTSSDQSYVLAQGIQGLNSQNFNFQMQGMSRAQQAGAQAQMFVSTVGTRAGDESQQGNVQQATQGYMQYLQGEQSYFQSMLMQQKQFNISRDRAEEDFGITRERMDLQYDISRSRAQQDFNISRKQQEYDYNLSRTRAQEDYNLQVTRTTESYARSMNRAQFDFNLSRKRQESDYQHSVMLMTEQNAKSMYDIYQRPDVTRFTSASYLLTNNQDQVQRLQEQTANLNTVRKLGLSKQAIQQLGLTSTDNAQELATLVAQYQQNPELVQQMNKSIKQRMKAARGLVTDESSAEWDEFTRQYKLSTNRAQADFQRQVERSHKDFNIQMNQMEHDFQKSMNHQAEDFQTAEERQQNQFSLSMSRAAEDYARSVDQMTQDFNKSMQRSQQDLLMMSTQITGSLESILERSVKRLGGHAKQEAKVVLSTFKDLGAGLGSQGSDIMMQMAQIFGFKYTPPKAVGGPTGPHQGGTQEGQANGGIVPGWTPGRDTQMVPLSGGEAIMRPEWARAVGAGAIDAMNHAAKHGGFAGGGVYRPINVPVSRGVHDVSTGYPAIDMAAPVGTPVYAVNSGTITRSGDIAGPLASDQYHNAAYGPYGSYGRVMYLKTDMGPEVIYAHLSQRGLVAGTHVRAGQPIAASGSTGNSSGPHLHFGDSDGNPMEFILNTMLGHGHIKGDAGHAPLLGDLSTGGGNLVRQFMQTVLKKRYPQIERLASSVKYGGGIHSGDMSNALNYYAVKDLHKAAKGWHAQGGVFMGAQTIGIGENGPEMVIPLNSGGVNFLNSLLEKSSVGLDGRITNVHGSTPMPSTMINNYRIDKSTSFTGPITVMANDPNQMLAQLQQRARTHALSNASLGGTRV